MENNNFATYMRHSINEIVFEIDHESNGLPRIIWMEEEFCEWLRGQGFADGSIKSYCAWLRTAAKEMCNTYWEADSQSAEDLPYSYFFISLKKSAISGNREAVDDLFGYARIFLTEFRKEAYALGFAEETVRNWGSAMEKYCRFVEQWLGAHTDEERAVEEEIPLLKEFQKWMVDVVGHTEGSSRSYGTYLRQLNSGFISQHPLNGKNPFTTTEHPENWMCRLEHIEELLQRDLPHDPLTDKQFSDGKSAFRKYMIFIASRLELDEKVEALTVDTSEKGCNKTDKEALIINFRKRISTQDRISSDRKVDFSPKTIGYLFNMEKGADCNDFVERWSRKCLDDIRFLIEGGELTLGQVRCLNVYPDTQRVTVTDSQGNSHILMTHTTVQGELLPMQSTTLSEIHIDHMVSMDEILIEHASELPAMEGLTSIMREVLGLHPSIKTTTKSGNPKYEFGLWADLIWGDDTLREQVISLFPRLMQEMELIRGWQHLEMMQGNYNRAKGNR